MRNNLTGVGRSFTFAHSAFVGFGVNWLENGRLGLHVGNLTHSNTGGERPRLTH